MRWWHIHGSHSRLPANRLELEDGFICLKGPYSLAEPHGAWEMSVRESREWFDFLAERRLLLIPDPRFRVRIQAHANLVVACDLL